MPDNMCKWKPKYLSGDKCHEPPFDEKGLCVLHSEREDKDIDEFEKRVNERITKGRLTPSGWETDKIDLVGCYFPERFPAGYFRGHIFDKPVDFLEAKFTQAAYFDGARFSQANFSRATFSKRAYFGGATFSQADFSGARFSQANFSRATFSKEAYFGGATFSELAYFGWATFSELAYFGGATFSQEADFGGARFSEQADFSRATFSKKADFFMAKFKESAIFLRASFRESAVFSGAVFKDNANFDSTAFKGRTDFKWAEFWGWTFFYRNSRLTYAMPEKRLELGEIEWPGGVKDKIDYDEFTNLLSFEGRMSQAEKGELLGLSGDASYKKAINELYDLSQITTLGKESVFHYARFEGETIRFQDVDLSNASFLHSNIDKVDFRYCKFGKKKGRQNVLKDERDCIKNVKKADKGPFPYNGRVFMDTAEERVARDGYEPAYRLYTELKKNFEEKRDWNTAGDFHYGEMECRRKMKDGWLRRNILSLEAIYFWLSGYGERPLRAAVSLGLLIGVCAVLYMYFEGLVSRFDGDYVRAILKSGCDSIKITTLQRIGHVDEYDSLPANAVFMFESIMGPILIALFALALRRKVKR